VDVGLLVAVTLAVAFAVTNGLHDASNAIAALVATRAATPLQAIVLASVFNVLGPLLVGSAVADTIGGIVTVAPSEAVEVIGAGLAAAVAWNVATWRLGLPSSSGHALVGGSSARACSPADATGSSGAGSMGSVRWASRAR
jgi:PiT family inorganic phosphate transporter